MYVRLAKSHKVYITAYAANIIHIIRSTYVQVLPTAVFTS